MFLMREGILDEKGINQLEKAGRRRAAGRGRSRAGGACRRRRTSVMKFVYSPDLDPTSAAFDTQAAAAAEAGGRRQEAGRQDHGRPDQRHAARRDEARRAHRDLRRRRGRLQPRRISEAEAGQRQGRSLQADVRPADANSAPTASSTRRWPRPTSWAAPLAWRRAG